MNYLIAALAFGTMLTGGTYAYAGYHADASTAVPAVAQARGAILGHESTQDAVDATAALNLWLEEQHAAADDDATADGQLAVNGNALLAL